MDLVREYAQSGSEAAFAALVSRHINLVYAAAMRQVGNPRQAEEITQAVFTILAKKAGALGRATILSGWLFETTRLTAANLRRGEFRRARREQEAYMESIDKDAGADVWEQVAPLLDTAIAYLGEKDRNAVVMRYIEGKGLREVGAALGATEAAAQKRVNRAVDKLRVFFTKRGVVLTGTVLVSALAANSVAAAPAGLAASVKAVAVMKGATASASTLALIKGTLKLMAWTKIKLTVGAGVAALLLAGGGITLSVARSSTSSVAVAEIAKKAQGKYAALTSYSDTGKIIADRDGNQSTTTFSIRLGRPNYYRVEWEQGASKGAAWSAGEGDFMLNAAKTVRMANANMALGVAAGVSGGATTGVPEMFLKGSYDVLNILARSKDVSRLKDEEAGGVDCYVLTCAMPAPAQALKTVKIGAGTITLWIGKEDYLIHQQRQSMNGLKKEATPQTPAVTIKKFTTTQTHENIVIDEPVTKADFAYP